MFKRKDYEKALKELEEVLVYTEYLDGRAVDQYRINEEETEMFKNLIEEYYDTIEKNKNLEKCFDIALENLENLSYVRGLGQVGKNYQEWKKYCTEKAQLILKKGE